MWMPDLISENRTRWSAIQVSPEALGRRRTGWPPSTGTVQVSHSPSDTKFVYATRVPSGVNTGPYFRLGDVVSCTDSPFGSSLTKISPGPKNESPPRLKVTIRPSGDKLGAVAESLKFVSCMYSDGDVTATGGFTK